MSLLQNNPCASEPTSMRRTAILMIVDVPDDLSDAMVHDSVLRNQKYLFQNMDRDGVPCELVSFDVNENLQLQAGASQPPRQSEQRAGRETTSEACPPRLYVLRWCSRCDRAYGKTPCAVEDHGKKTHGLCPFHQSEANAGLEALRAEKKFAQKQHQEKADLIPVNG